MYEILKYQKIKDLREDKDLTQKQVADYLNIKQNTYSRYESCDREIPNDILIQLALYHNTSLDYLVGLTNEKKPYPRIKK